jgi:hypothetical protein
MNKKIKVLILGFILGCVFSAWPYLLDSQGNNQATPEIKAAPVVFSPEPDEKIYKNTPDLDAISALSIPNPSEPIEQWERFWINIEALDLGPSGSPMGSTSPILAFYVYIAKHQPDLFYQKMNFMISHYSFVEKIMRLGLLGDWYDHVNKPDRWLLISKGAVKSLVAKVGEEKGRRLVANAFIFSSLNSVKVSLYNLRFASGAMTKAETELVLDRLLSEKFKYDPREVKALIGVNTISNKQLIQLIKTQAYSQKSMSSYMTSALRAGDPEYVYVMAKDAANNADQPTNFYCSGCSLSLYTEGLIGDALVDAASNNKISVSNSSGQLIIKRLASSDKGDQ